jgi:hypothetical protein
MDHGRRGLKWTAAKTTGDSSLNKQENRNNPGDLTLGGLPGGRLPAEGSQPIDLK